MLSLYSVQGFLLIPCCTTGVQNKWFSTVGMKVSEGLTGSPLKFITHTYWKFFLFLLICFDVSHVKNWTGKQCWLPLILQMQLIWVFTSSKSQSCHCSAWYSKYCCGSCVNSDSEITMKKSRWVDKFKYEFIRADFRNKNLSEESQSINVCIYLCWACCWEGI